MIMLALAVLAANPTNIGTIFNTAKPGDTIRLVAGLYPYTIVRSRTFNPPLTVDASAATLTGMKFMGTSGVHWNGGKFDGSTLPTLTNAFGFSAGNGSDVKVTGASFTTLQVGVVFGEINGGEVSNSSFTGMTGDGIDVALSRSVLVSHNTCTAFKPGPSAHPDCIQAWSKPTVAPVADIQVIGNTMVGDMQGISFFDGDVNGVKQGGFDRVTIKDNNVLITYGNGIAAQNCRSCTIRNNTVDSLPNYKYVAMLNATGSVINCGNNVVKVKWMSTPPCKD